MKSKLTSSILLVLLCLGAFHFNQVQAACDSSVTNECATCDDPATTQCLTCQDHYAYNSDGKSCNRCSTTNYYLPTGKTLESECVPGPDNCWMIYIDGTCKTCDDQYVLSADAKTCGPCSDPTKYLPKGKLIDTECVAGPANCAQTNIVGTCKTCADHYILSDDAKTCGTCSVATKYLPTGKTKDSECIDGPANCKTLNVDGTCKTCNDQYVLSADGKTCGACSDATKYLPTGKTKDSECVAGPANCAQTNIVGTCKTCADHYILSADVKTCGTCSVATKYLPTGKTTDDQCIDGPANCKTLNVDGTCKTCATNYVLSDDAKTCGACSDSSKYLPSGKTKDSDCVACTANCKTCSVPGVCGACADGYYLDATTKTCKACDTGCAKCTGTGADKCTTCSTKYFADTSSKLCKACDTGCDTCSGNGADKCSQCSAYYYVDTTSKVCQTCPTGKYLPAGKTLSTDCTACADGKYMKEGGTTLEECLACDAGCAKCTGTGSGKCTTCSAQFYLDDTCKSCGDGKYLPNGKSTAADCATCDTGCAKCTGTGNGQCTTCSTNYYLDGICKTCNDKNKYFPANGKIADDCVECAYKCTECNVDGTCKTCETGRYVKDGKCTPCSKGCTTCGSDGKCTVCADGYYLSSGACVACTTGCTKCDSATKCTACDATAYYLSSDACKTCSTGCTACGSGGKCTACASGYYYDDVKGTCTACTGSACTTCGADLKCTKCSSGYVLDSKAACTTCPTGCTECSTDGTCTKCDYNYSFLKNACTACPTGTYVGAGTELAASCTACTSGQYYSETEHKCKDCFKKDTSNCKACSGPNIGQCALCNDNFNLVSGTCVSKDTEVKARTGSASAKIRFDMDLDNYNSNGGANFFAAQVADSLKVSIEQVQVTGTQIGSVIVLFTVFSTGATTPADLTQQINNALAQGNLNVYGNSVVVMDSNAVVLLPNGCPSGQYYDSATYACKDCTDDICGEKKSKVGAIVGGVLGGLAFIVIIAVLIWKKDVIFGKMKSNKVVSAEYNGLNTMSPTATAFKTEGA